MTDGLLDALEQLQDELAAAERTITARDERIANLTYDLSEADRRERNLEALLDEANEANDHLRHLAVCE